MKEVTIEALRVSLMNYNRVVVLKEKDADRYLTIYIGAAEADAIAIRLQNVSVQRPMTHDLNDQRDGGVGSQRVAGGGDRGAQRHLLRAGVPGP